MSFLSTVTNASDNLNGYLSNIGGGALSDITKASSAISGVGNVVSGLISPYASLLGIVGLDGKYQKTIGSILANGFDITCWGSSNPPTKTKANLEKYFKPYFDQIANNLLNGDLISINRFIYDVYLTYYQCLEFQGEHKWSKCSKKGVKMYLDFMTPLFKKASELVSIMETAGNKIFYLSEKGNMTLNGFKVEGSANKVQQIPQFKSTIQPVNEINAITSIASSPTQIPKVSVELSSLSPSVSPVLTQLKTGDTTEYMMQGGELSEVKIAGYKKPVEEKKSSSFPWWLLPLAIGLS